MTHTVNSMSRAIGQVVNIKLESFRVPMTVLDVKSAWGEIRLLVSPVNGLGQAWVTLARVSKASLLVYETEEALDQIPPRCDHISDDGLRTGVNAALYKLEALRR